MADPANKRLSGRILSLLIRALSHFPLPVLYLIADLLYVILYQLLHFQRSLILDNIARAFPKLPSSRVQQIAARSSRNAIHAVFEAIYSKQLSPATLARRVTIENPQLIDELTASHGTVLAVAAHHGNWEWLQLACSAQLGVPLAALYKPLNDESIDQFLYRMRSRFGSRLIEAQSALPELVRFSRHPGVIAMVADQGPRPDEDKYWSCFMGRDTAFYPGVEKVARLLKAPVVFVHMQRKHRGYYHIRFELLAEPPFQRDTGDIMERYIRAVERQVCEAPEDWIWAYKRWKYQRSVYDS